MKSISLVIHDLILRTYLFSSNYVQTSMFEYDPGVTTILSNGYHYIDLKFGCKVDTPNQKLRNYTSDMLIKTLWIW